MRGHARVQPARLLLCRRRNREIRIATVGTGAREDLDAIAAEKRLDLRFSAADSGCRGDHFGPDGLLLSVRVRDFPATKRIDGSLIQTDHGAQRSGDKMQFILNDQVRRQERFGQRLPGGIGVARAIEPARVGALHLTEQLARLAFPRKAGELIDGRN